MANELLGARQGVADGVNELIFRGLTEARPIKFLSPEGGDNVLQLMEDSGGQQFVTRAFTPRLVESIKDRSLMSFPEAWDKMYEIFDEAGIRVLPSHLLETPGDYPFTVVSPYVGDGVDISEASTDVKVNLAENISNFLNYGQPYVPSLEMLSYGMFLVTNDENGSPTPFLVDLDPRIIIRLPLDSFDAVYLRKFGELFWDHWCKEHERTKVMSALVKSISMSNTRLSEDFDPNTEAAQVFMDLQLMSNGVDPSHLTSFR